MGTPQPLRKSVPQAQAKEKLSLILLFVNDAFSIFSFVIEPFKRKSATVFTLITVGGKCSELDFGKNVY